MDASAAPLGARSATAEAHRFEFGTSHAAGYQVVTPVFEGPFDLLLHLILRQEVDLWEISLSTIVDAYLTEVDQMPQVDLEVATAFLLVASTLVELKSRRLLPGSRRHGDRRGAPPHRGS